MENTTGLLVAMIIVGFICSFVSLRLGIYIGSRWKENDIDDFSKMSIEPELSNESTKQTITVYNADGNTIKQYKSCLDVEGDDYSIIFNDENGRGHEIYYSIGIVIVDEE